MQTIADYFNHYEQEWERCFAHDRTLSAFVNTMAVNPMLCRVYVVGETSEQAAISVRNELRRGVVVYSGLLGAKPLATLINYGYEVFFESILLCTLKIPALTNVVDDELQRNANAVLGLVASMSENIYPADVKTRIEWITQRLDTLCLQEPVLALCKNMMAFLPQQPRLIH